MARETAIVARALEEVTMTAMRTAVWRAGSVFISNANFMPKNCGKGGNCINNRKKCAGVGRLCERREPGVMQPAKVTATASPWFLGEGENLVVRKFRLRSRTTDRPDTDTRIKNPQR